MSAPHCLMRCIWRERNGRSFEDTKRTMPDLKLFFLRTLLDWMSVIHGHSLCSVTVLLDSCNLFVIVWSPAVYSMYTGLILFLYK